MFKLIMEALVYHPYIYFAMCLALGIAYFCALHIIEVKYLGKKVQFAPKKEIPTQFIDIKEIS